MVDNNVLAVLQVEQTKDTIFDRGSILIDEIPKELTRNSFSVQSNQDLSAMDKQFIAQIYPKE